MGLWFCIAAAASAAGDIAPGELAARDIHIRDPFILPVPEEGRYYLYGTIFPLDDGPGFPVYSSADLLTWEGPQAAFRHSPGFWADRDFWAPEVHRYQGRYYMFASFKAEGRCRGTQILAADTPRGPFVPLGDGPVTPKEWECLDGTLFVDDVARPWIVFCHEWLQVDDGEICAVPLTPDLLRADGEPRLLFRASEAPWVREARPDGHKLVTDGPFLYRASTGPLLMLWSSFAKQGYALAVATSASGKLEGPWTQSETPLYTDDGGHGMLFRDLAGNLLLSIHKPNKRPLERLLLLRVKEKDDGLIIVGNR